MKLFPVDIQIIYFGLRINIQIILRRKGLSWKTSYSISDHCTVLHYFPKTYLKGEHRTRWILVGFSMSGLLGLSCNYLRETMAIARNFTEKLSKKLLSFTSDKGKGMQPNIQWSWNKFDGNPLHLVSSRVNFLMGNY